jgi:hypothetical protein
VTGAAYHPPIMPSAFRTLLVHMGTLSPRQPHFSNVTSTTHQQLQESVSEGLRAGVIPKRGIVHVSIQEAITMETITIPSPTAFLTSPVIKPAPEPPPVPKRKPPPAKASASTTKKKTGIVKPKQSKSRNGMSGELGSPLS